MEFSDEFSNEIISVFYVLMVSLYKRNPWATIGIYFFPVQILVKLKTGMLLLCKWYKKTLLRAKLSFELSKLESNVCAELISSEM